MNKEEFIEKLQATYFGDRNAFNEIVNTYDKLSNALTSAEVKVDKAMEFIKSYKEEWNEYDEVINDMNQLLKILEGKIED